MSEIRGSKVEQILQDAESNLSISFVRSTGSGGQNVNKRNTACQIIDSFDYISFIPKENIDKYKSPVVIKYSRERSQEQNKRRAIDIWRQKIIDLFIIDKPRTINPKIKAKFKRKKDKIRLEGKKHRSEIKKYRKKIDY